MCQEKKVRKRRVSPIKAVTKIIAKPIRAAFVMRLKVVSFTDIVDAAFVPLDLVPVLLDLALSPETINLLAVLANPVDDFQVLFLLSGNHLVVVVAEFLCYNGRRVPAQIIVEHYGNRAVWRVVWQVTNLRGVALLVRVEKIEVALSDTHFYQGIEVWH
jgi:hypothetical protein